MAGHYGNWLLATDVARGDHNVIRNWQ